MNNDYIDNSLKDRIKEENMQVSDFVNNRIDETLSSLTPNKKRPFHKTKIATGIAAGIIAISSVMPIHANGVPIVGSAFEYFTSSKDDHNKVLDQYVKFSEAVNQSEKNKDIKVTINEVSCDNNYLVIGFTLESDKKLKAGEIFDVDFFANGKQLGGNYDVDEKSESDYKVKGILTKGVSSDKIPEDFNLDLNVVYVGNIKGTWDFKFNISKAEANKSTRTYTPGITAKVPSSTITINKVTMSPFANTVSTTQTVDSISTISYGFIVVDENNNILRTEPVDGHGNNSVFNDTIKFYSNNEQLNSITLIPYKNKYKECPDAGFTNPEDISKLPITFDIGYRGSVTIDKIDFNDNNTLVHYNLKGYGGTSICLVDEDGREISRDDSPYPNPKLIDGQKGEYTESLKKADKNKKYKIKVYKNCPVEFFDDYKIKIPLK